MGAWDKRERARLHRGRRPWVGLGSPAGYTHRGGWRGVGVIGEGGGDSAWGPARMGVGVIGEDGGDLVCGEYCGDVRGAEIKGGSVG